MDKNKKDIIDTNEEDVKNPETEDLKEILEEETSTNDDINQDDTDLLGLIEAVLFLSNDPVPLSFFVKNFSIDPTHAKILINSLLDEYIERDGGVLLIQIAKGYQFVTNAKYSDQLKLALGMKKRDKLSKGMLETLAIVAYKQPIVLVDVDELRGVSSRMMVANLMKRNLVKPVGRMNLPGRPLAYGTTDKFLIYFGLNKLSDLPKLSEIKEFSIDTDI